MMHDKPVSGVKNDLFRRSEFSMRIADLIINRQEKESVVYGINGAWGEGKTSVLNFITERLNDSPNVVVINFNPWRYSDETKLLESYFATIAKELYKSLSSDELQFGMLQFRRWYKIKKAAGILAKYGDAISAIPMAGSDSIGSTAKSALERLSTVDFNAWFDRMQKSKKFFLLIPDCIARIRK